MEDCCREAVLNNVFGTYNVANAAEKYGAEIVPVDSEHSAIFQSIQGCQNRNEIRRLLLTCSGGPFFGKTYKKLEHMRPEHALKHPNWSMGAKITIDSASMFNKALEIMEARWLFDMPPEKIQVVVHPQSIVHSMVQFADGSVKAQLGTPDMRLPIQYAFSYPGRWQSSFPRVDFASLGSLTFENPDPVRFRNLALAFEAIERGGNMPCILNAANEVCVDAFLHDRIGFLRMSDVIADTMQRVTYIARPTYDDYVATDREARRVASDCLNHGELRTVN